MKDRLKIGQEVLIHGYVDEIRKDTIIIQNEGGYFGTVECEITDIDMPDTNDVLEQIRAEIEEAIGSYVCDKEKNTMKAQGMLNAMQMTFDIIDKYMKEQTE